MISGPYMNDDGDWWVRTDEASFREARAAIVGCLSYSIPEDGTLLYKGRVITWLTDDEGDDPVHYEAWHFVENRKW